MSTKVSKSKFLEYLKALIRKEIEEASTTVSAGGGVGKGIYYDTPYSFAGKDKKTGKKKDRRDDIANKSGYTKVESKRPVFKYQGPVHKNSRAAMKWAQTQNFKKDYVLKSLFAQWNWIPSLIIISSLFHSLGFFIKLKCVDDTFNFFASSIIFFITCLNLFFLFFIFLLIIILSPATGVNGIADWSFG